MPVHGIIALIRPAHILAGMLALGFGYVALYATKGLTLHRKSGMLFVYAMVTMSLGRCGSPPRRFSGARRTECPR